MLSLELLSSRVSAYADGNISFEDLANWFEDNATYEDYQNPELRPILGSVDAAFSGYQFDHVAERALKKQLLEAVALRPFVLGPVYAPAQTFAFELGNPQGEIVFGTSTPHPISWALAVG